MTEKTFWKAATDPGSVYGVAHVECSVCGYRPKMVTAESRCPVCYPRERIEEALLKACKVFIEEMEK